MNTLIKEITTPNRQYKAVIWQKGAAVLMIEFRRWNLGIVDGEEVCYPYWDRAGHPIWTDTLEHAEQLAAEELLIIRL